MTAHMRRRRPITLVLFLALAGGRVAAAQEGVRWVGRWLASDAGQTATYAGSQVILSFGHSASVAVDLGVSNTQMNAQDLYIAVTIDGGKAIRMGLSPGTHVHVTLASGLSSGEHTVAIRKEGEPYFGALRVANPTLEPHGVWRKTAGDRPIVEVLGDSDATGICALGPDSPAHAVNLFNAAWASEAISWVGLLEAELAGVGHPVDMVNLAISGSNAKDEAVSYAYTAFSYSDAKFQEYAQPGHKHASMVFMWGGANDRHAGGDTAHGRAVTPDTLSPFQAGIYSQLTAILRRNPDVKIVLLDYIDPTIPDWQRAYAQVTGLFTEAQRQQFFFLSVRDPKNLSDACKIDPQGHPNASMHTTWAAQIFAWMMTPGMLHRLGFSDREQWYDE